MKIGFIGGGAMAEAIISGIYAKPWLKSQDIYVSDHKEIRCKELQKKYKINAVVGAQSFIKEVDVLILAVKPQVAIAAMDEVKSQLKAKTVVISIIAGLTIAQLEKFFTHNPVIRVMPNTPMAVGEGMSAITLGSRAAKDDGELAEKIFSAAGKAVIVEEKLMDAVSGLSGSSPAFIFVIIDAMADAGVNAGLKRKAAIEIAAQAVLGSAKMVLETGLHPAQLRDQVTSPAGTTIAGVRVMEQQCVRGAMIDAITASVEKSKVMGKD